MQQDRVVAEDKERGRRATLERVNKMIFHETDSAKGFHSAALHCDVLAERTAQVEFKQQVRCFLVADSLAETLLLSHSLLNLHCYHPHFLKTTVSRNSTVMLLLAFSFVRELLDRYADEVGVSQ